MIKKTVEHIHNLRIFFLALILVCFMSVIGLNPVDIGKYIGLKIVQAVDKSTATATIEPNPYNTLAKQLKDKQATLDNREHTLTEKEAELLRINAGQNKIIIALAIGIIILFLLISFNYFLDYKRRKASKK